MFTIEQIKSAHSKVKSGADFPKYIKEIKELGVIGYEVFVMDGSVNYFGVNDFQVNAPAKYEKLIISETTNIDEFKSQLLAHQQGKTDYLTFIKMCASTGVNKWEIKMDRMTCTYFDKLGNEVLVENIPQ